MDELEIKEKKLRNKAIFDYIVLMGMVVNIVIAVFMVLYYFNLL
jgi:hypothetical protein